MKSDMYRILTAILCLAWRLQAETNVLTFEFLGPGSALTNYATTPLRDQHMIFSGYPTATHYFLGTNAPQYAGSVGLFRSATNGSTILARTNGATFDFLGISLAAMVDQSGTVSFQGYRGFDIVATQTCSVAAFTIGHRFLTNDFTHFTNITEVRWSSATPHQFDNVRVRLEPSAPPSEPKVRLLAFTGTNSQGQPFRYGAFGVSGLAPGRSYEFQGSTNLTDWERLPVLGHSYATFDPTIYLSIFVEPHKYFRLKLQ